MGTKRTDIGQRIKKIRINRGLTQKELAERLHVTPAMIGQYERGLRTPRKKNLLKIAEALGVSAIALDPDLSSSAQEIINSTRKEFDPDFAQMLADTNSEVMTPGAAQELMRLELEYAWEDIVNDAALSNVIVLLDYLVSFVLNVEGVAKLIDYAEFLSTNSKYKK